MQILEVRMAILQMMMLGLMWKMISSINGIMMAGAMQMEALSQYTLDGVSWNHQETLMMALIMMEMA